MTLILRSIEDDLNFKVTGGLPKCVANRRRHQFNGKWKTTIILLLMELDFLNVNFVLRKDSLASPRFS